MTPTHGINPSRGWRLAALAARLVVGVLFVMTGVAKLTGIERFVEEVRRYEMLPLVATNAVAYVLPWMEVVAGLALLLSLWRREARWILGALLVVFTAAKACAFARGLEIECGCGGSFTFLKHLFDLPQGILTNLVLLALLGLDGHAQRRSQASVTVAQDAWAEDCPRSSPGAS